MDEYPSDGQVAGVYQPEPDEQRAKELRTEEATMATALPIIENIIEWFNDEMRWADSIQRIDLKANSQVPANAQVLAFQELSRLLHNKRDELQSRLNAFKAEQEEKRDAA